MVIGKDATRRDGCTMARQITDRVYDERKTTMRILMKFVQVLVATLLFAGPVMGDRRTARIGRQWPCPG